MLFDDAWSLARIGLVGTLAYVALIVLRRASGKRTLSKLNAFDFVVTVALGSTLATVLLSKEADGRAHPAGLPGPLALLRHAPSPRDPG